MDVAAGELGVEVTVKVDLDEIVGLGLPFFGAGDALLANLLEFSLGKDGSRSSSRTRRNESAKIGIEGADAGAGVESMPPLTLICAFSLSVSILNLLTIFVFGTAHQERARYFGLRWLCRRGTSRRRSGC